jgi:hypothetical protein
MTPFPPRITVIIPSYNRPEPLKFTLRSVARAAKVLGEPVETILVDDGSIPPMAEQLLGFECGTSVTQLRQANQGSIVARLTGLRAAQGEYVLFLDSDDVVHPEKLSRQLDAMKEGRADVSYADMAVATPGTDYEIAGYEPAQTLAATDDPARLFIEVQPAPHNPIYRRDYLNRALEFPIVKPQRAMDPSGDVWLYYNVAVFPARIVKVGAPLSAPGPHEEDRYSQHWEKLGMAALRIRECFMDACPDTQETLSARRAAGEAAFRTWRALPRHFNRDFESRMLAIFRRSPRGPFGRLGTSSFARLACAIGPISAGRLIRALRARPYNETRTLSPEEYTRLFAEAGTGQ